MRTAGVFRGLSTRSGFRPEAFRFFDWQSWLHIEGEMTWHGRRETMVNGKRMTLISGFTYRPVGLPEGVGNLGLRVAEGVEGTLRVFCGDAIVSVEFEPGYWMLEPGSNGYRAVPIRDNDLMVLIVSLSEGASRSALSEILSYVWNRGLEPAELTLIRGAIGEVERGKEDGAGGMNHALALPMHPGSTS